MVNPRPPAPSTHSYQSGTKAANQWDQGPAGSWPLPKEIRADG
jgi:hypothetical protein